MTTYPRTPIEVRALADAASQAIRQLNHATHPADGFPGLEYPSDACQLLAAVQELAGRLPQLLGQISAFLQYQLQHDVIEIAGGPFFGDPLGAIATASHELEARATGAARHLADALDVAQQVIAFAAGADGAP
jgi:hypothetical protein